MAFFKPSRVLAVALILGAGAWIASGMLGPHGETAPAAEPAAAEPAKIPLQKVAVTMSRPEEHQRRIVLSCVTQADRSVMSVARGGGVITELKVKRGSRVEAGDVIAVLSDEGRDAAVKQAQALLDQRKAEYEANKRLIDRGDAPKNQLPALESAVAAAEAALSAARAEAEKSVVRAAISGMIDSVPIQEGQAVQPGTEIAEIIDPDPMLAVGQVGERERNSLDVGAQATIRFIDESAVTGSVSFVGLSADRATRTYRVEASMSNPTAQIADGVSCEMVVMLKPVEAASVPKSALVFSDDGHLGVRTVVDDRALFAAITIVDDARDVVWVTGLAGETSVIVVGQDFVKDGDEVEAVPADAAVANAGGPPA